MLCRGNTTVLVCSDLYVKQSPVILQNLWGTKTIQLRITASAWPYSVWVSWSFRTVWMQPAESVHCTVNRDRTKTVWILNRFGAQQQSCVRTDSFLFQSFVDLFNEHNDWQRSTALPWPSLHRAGFVIVSQQSYHFQKSTYLIEVSSVLTLKLAYHRTSTFQANTMLAFQSFGNLRTHEGSMIQELPGSLEPLQ